VTHQREHQREGLLRRRDRVGVGSIEDDDAGVGRGVDVNRVDADSGTRDDHQVWPGCEELTVDARLRADDETVGFGERLHELLARGADSRGNLDTATAQHVEADIGERLGDDDAPRFLGQNRNRLPLGFK